ncbi:thiamine phosphate synthase [Thalassospiraceae bacterium LMO-JJ14]|nr:thiamine phosphate synthase [Thalassospiraceae bacterium LMO-JJ14]
MTKNAPPEPCKLYLLSPPEIEPVAFAALLERSIAAKPEIVGAVQLRLKNVSDDDFLRAAETLRPVCHGFDLPLIINDRPDIAAATGCDGVHIGQEDASYDEARKLLGVDGIIGVTCHDSRDLAIEAGEKGADYVAFGAFFPSDSKETKHHADPEIIEVWSQMTTLPCVAIGGITADNCAPLVAAGADYLAVIGSVWNHPEGPEAGVAAFAGILSGA